VLAAESYLYLVHYKEIVKANWGLFGACMEKASGKQGKDSASSWMNDLNPIRNAVMHPGKREITVEDLEALKEANRITSQFTALLGANTWPT